MRHCSTHPIHGHLGFRTYLQKGLSTQDVFFTHLSQARLMEQTHFYFNQLALHFTHIHVYFRPIHEQNYSDCLLGFERYQNTGDLTCDVPELTLCKTEAAAAAVAAAWVTLSLISTQPV